MRAPRARVAHVVYSPAIGGSESLALETCARLDRRAFDPLLLLAYPGSGPLPQLARARGVAVEHLRRTRARRLVWRFVLGRQLRRLGVDLLHVHHVPLYAAVERAARASGIPVLVTEHARHTLSRSPRLQQVARRAVAQAAHFSVVSYDLARWFVAELGVDPQRIEVIHGGIDVTRFTPGCDAAPLRALAAGAGTGPIVVSVGRLVEAKHQELLIDATARLADVGAILVLVGDGDRRQALERHAEGAGARGRVVFAGTRADIPSLLPGADVFALSSRREGLPVALMEAMAAGLPVVATAVGGVPELVVHGRTGLLVPPEDAGRLADALRQLLADRERARAMAAAGRARVEQEFSLETVVGTYERRYRGVRRAAERARAARRRPDAYTEGAE